MDSNKAGGHVVFCNPPYGRRIKNKPGQEDWIKKSLYESQNNGITVVMLIPARTDTKIHHECIFKFAKYICFVRGRLKFGEKDSAPFPSELVVFTNKNYDDEICKLADVGFWIKLKEGD